MITKTIHLPDIIYQIDSSLKHENYIAALTLALMIPDKCGKIEHPDWPSKKRYVDWYDTHCWCDGYCVINNPSISEDELPNVDGAFIYQLRCAMLHENTTELDYSKLEDKNKVDEFQLILADSSEDIFSVFASGIINGEKRLARIRLIDLCKLICYAANEYYEGNKEKVDSSNNIQIIDVRTLKRQRQRNYKRVQQI